MRVKFPTLLNKNTFVFTMASMYLLLMLDAANLFSEKSYNIKFFYNDFNEKGYLAWFVSSIQTSLFLMVISRASCIMITDPLIKSIFFAIMIDSFFTLTGTIVFGYYENIGAIIIRNLFVVLSFIYAYVVLFKPENNDTRGS